MWDYIIGALQRQLPGLRLSVEITIVSSIIGLTIGFVWGNLLTSKTRWIRYSTIVIVEIVRGFPALLVLYLVYYGLPNISITLSGITAAVVAFGMTIAGYTAEIFRSAIASVPRGELEAAKALALKPRTITRLVVLPYVGRVVVPPLIGIIVIGFQGTALAISVGVSELTGKAFQYGQVHFAILPEIAVAAVLYLVVTSLLIGVEVVMERRANRMAGKNFGKRRALKLSTEGSIQVIG